jgi:hypothetical protein
MTMKHLIIATLPLLFFGCGGSKELEKPKIPSAENGDTANESVFRPSEYDMDVKVFFSELRKEKERKAIPSEPALLEPAVIVPGFRVQLFATEDIDEANLKKAEAEAAFPEEWFYIVFDPPAYKLRSGNFLSRPEADEYAKLLADNFFPDAWVVPERVIKNIKPRPLQQVPQEQQPPK